MLIGLTAAALTTVALSLPAAAATAGCKIENPRSDSVKATTADCRRALNTRRGHSSMAYAPRAHHKKIVRSSKPMRQPAAKGTSDNPGLTGGASD
jgi:hypothetical protein